MAGNRLANEVVFVNGASRGIGRATALLAAEEGGYVGAAVRTEHDAANLENEFRARDLGNFTIVLMDVNRLRTVEPAIKKVMREADAPISVSFPIAGITRDNLASKMTDREWSDVIKTNLTGSWRVVRAALPKMIAARRGSVVPESSIVGIHGSPGQPNYAAAKGGVIMYTRSLALSPAHQKRNVRFNVNAPGLVDTEMTRVLPTKVLDDIRAQTPLGRALTPEEIARSNIDLAVSGLNDGTNNEVMVSDGGFTFQKLGGTAGYLQWSHRGGIIVPESVNDFMDEAA